MFVRPGGDGQKTAHTIEELSFFQLKCHFLSFEVPVCTVFLSISGFFVFLDMVVWCEQALLVAVATTWNSERQSEQGVDAGQRGTHSLITVVDALHSQKQSESGICGPHLC